MSNWLIPVYNEGFADPFYQSPWAVNPYAPMGGVMRDMNRMMRHVENLFPFYEPGAFQPHIGPSDLAPVTTGDKYQINIAAQEYKPNEITVKTVDRDGKKFLVAEGKHETKDASGYHSVHHFKRQYMVPENVKVDQFKSSLTADGTLTIEAPQVPQAAIKDKETNIPVQMIESKK